MISAFTDFSKINYLVIIGYFNPLGLRIFIKTCQHVPRISGKFRAILHPCVKKSVEKNYSILTITSCVYFED